MKNAISYVVFGLIWALWYGTFWGFVACFGWLAGGVAGKWVDGQEGMWIGGAIGLGVMVAVVLGTAKLSKKMGTIQFGAGILGGGATLYTAAIVLGASSKTLPALAAFVGMIIGAASAVPRITTCFERLRSLLFLGAVSGTAITLILLFTTNTWRIIAAHALGLGLVGLIIGIYTPVDRSQSRTGLLAHSFLEWVLTGAVAGLLAAAITKSVALGGDALQSRLVEAVCGFLGCFLLAVAVLVNESRRKQEVVQPSPNVSE